MKYAHLLKLLNSGEPVPRAISAQDGKVWKCDVGVIKIQHQTNGAHSQTIVEGDNDSWHANGDVKSHRFFEHNSHQLKVFDLELISLSTPFATSARQMFE